MHGAEAIGRGFGGSGTTPPTSYLFGASRQMRLNYNTDLTSSQNTVSCILDFCLRTNQVVLHPRAVVALGTVRQALLRETLTQKRHAISGSLRISISAFLVVQSRQCQPNVLSIRRKAHRLFIQVYGARELS
jgi:hypothetical protein